MFEKYEAAEAAARNIMDALRESETNNSSTSTRSSTSDHSVVCSIGDSSLTANNEAAVAQILTSDDHFVTAENASIGKLEMGKATANILVTESEKESNSTSTSSRSSTGNHSIVTEKSLNANIGSPPPDCSAPNDHLATANTSSIAKVTLTTKTSIATNMKSVLKLKIRSVEQYEEYEAVKPTCEKKLFDKATAENYLLVKDEEVANVSLEEPFSTAAFFPINEDQPYLKVEKLLLKEENIETVEQPWLPSPLDENWLDLHNGFVSNNRVNGINITVPYIKDSIIRRWQTDGLHMYIEHYVPLRAAIVDGDSTQDVRQIKIIVRFIWTYQKLNLIAGTDNIPNGFTDSSIARGLTAIVNELSRGLPSTKILLVGVLPRNDSETSELTGSINKNVASLDNGNSVRFVNMVNRYHKQTGNFYDELYLNDLLPSSPQGCVEWNEVHLLLFDEMYNSATQPIIAGFYLMMLFCLSLLVFNFH
ncbi:hypothetical protein HA402_011538 [Bradysia odoriphaga]|nr:hypothetical protein HA402_011538 [Bradysia odoriphaga]